MPVELLFRWVSAIAVLTAAAATTVATVRWMPGLLRPPMTYLSVFLWLTTIYRLMLAVSAVPAGSEWGQFIRLWVSIEFLLMAVAAWLFAAVGWQWHKRGFTIGNSE